ncbi:MAG: cytochrome C [Thiobacillus sp.]|nr:cytochrome C [Thiobacillus sp.]
MFKTLVPSLVCLALAAPALASDITYRKDIRPLWNAQCAACHGASSPYLGDFLENQDKYTKMMKGPRMDTYADLIIFVGWPDTGAIMRRLDDGKNSKDGKPGNMYQYLGATDAERQKNFQIFKAWVGEDAWVHKRWDKKGDMPGVTKEELSKMKLKF